MGWDERVRPGLSLAYHGKEKKDGKLRDRFSAQHKGEPTQYSLPNAKEHTQSQSVRVLWWCYMPLPIDASCQIQAVLRCAQLSVLPCSQAALPITRHVINAGRVQRSQWPRSVNAFKSQTCLFLPAVPFSHVPQQQTKLPGAALPMVHLQPGWRASHSLHIPAQFGDQPCTKGGCDLPGTTPWNKPGGATTLMGFTAQSSLSHQLFYVQPLFHVAHHLVLTSSIQTQAGQSPRQPDLVGGNPARSSGLELDEF